MSEHDRTDAPHSASASHSSDPRPMPELIRCAPWGSRVASFLIDTMALYAVAIPVAVGYFMLLGEAEDAGAYNPDGTPAIGEIEPSNTALTLLIGGGVLVVGFFIWNLCIRQGRTGYSIGKSVLGIRLVRLRTGEPMGTFRSFVRQLAHYLDSIPCYLGYLWPLWDTKRQTFADKVTGTVVIEQPKN